jgi:cyclic pyranopterin phosphate synthase
MARKTKTLTHLDPDGMPAMVDVSAKATTTRDAQAECRVKFPTAVAEQLRASGLKSAKGGIVETAIIAGTMAVKRTHELIPFCHPLPIDGCRITIGWTNAPSTPGWRWSASRRDGGALTVYDMCKALARHRHRPAKLLGNAQRPARTEHAVEVLFSRRCARAGIASEQVDATWRILPLYAILQARHGFPSRSASCVAVDGVRRLGDPVRAAAVRHPAVGWLTCRVSAVRRARDRALLAAGRPRRQRQLRRLGARSQRRAGGHRPALRTYAALAERRRGDPDRQWPGILHAACAPHRRAGIGELACGSACPPRTVMLPSPPATGSSTR